VLLADEKDHCSVSCCFVEWPGRQENVHCYLTKFSTRQKYDVQTKILIRQILITTRSIQLCQRIPVDRFC
jgi:hypothetical protein